MRTIRKIIIHHSGTPMYAKGSTAEAFDKYHRAPPPKGKGYKAIGYHWVIEPALMVDCAEYGRPERIAGAHARGHNEDSIGVCIVGDFGGVGGKMRLSPPEGAKVPRARKGVALKAAKPDREPTPVQRKMLGRLLECLLRRYELSYEDVLLHRDVNETDCPGSITREWVLDAIDDAL
jgi:hypothetical protein